MPCIPPSGFSRFDAADYIENEEDAVLFLEAAHEEADFATPEDREAYLQHAKETVARARDRWARGNQAKGMVSPPAASEGGGD